MLTNKEPSSKLIEARGLNVPITAGISNIEVKENAGVSVQDSPESSAGIATSAQNDLMLDSATWQTFSSYKTQGSPINVIVLGMAGSGKTTFVTRLTEFLSRNGQAPYCINLDPACRDVPFHAHIDIRDSINYKALMRDYNLGPNGAIVTALNLYATKIEQVMQLLEQRRKEHSVYIYDTPGQIEVFTWSASGGLISEALAQRFPTVIVYVMDTPANAQPTTFVSNMLYACSIMYKMKLPFIIAMNKIDTKDCQFALEWMQDFEKLDKALEQDDSYAASLSQSLVLAIEEFYNCIKSTGISSATGAGFTRFSVMLTDAAREYETEYKSAIEQIKQERVEQKKDEHTQKLEQLRKNLEEGRL